MRAATRPVAISQACRYPPARPAVPGVPRTLSSRQPRRYAETHSEVYAMRTNVVIDDELVAEVMRVTHARS
ncbi:MAG: type II toxin-antitoxin system VapB family antitoxin [Thiomonas sp.]